jgi:hypothetical protein
MGEVDFYLSLVALLVCFGLVVWAIDKYDN